VVNNDSRVLLVVSLVKYTISLITNSMHINQFWLFWQRCCWVSEYAMMICYLTSPNLLAAATHLSSSIICTLRLRQLYRPNRPWEL